MRNFGRSIGSKGWTVAVRFVRPCRGARVAPGPRPGCDERAALEERRVRLHCCEQSTWNCRWAGESNCL